MANSNTYDSSWDREGNEAVWNEKYAGWKKRDWERVRVRIRVKLGNKPKCYYVKN